MKKKRPNLQIMSIMLCMLVFATTIPLTQATTSSINEITNGEDTNNIQTQFTRSTRFVIGKISNVWSGGGYDHFTHFHIDKALSMGGEKPHVQLIVDQNVSILTDGGCIGWLGKHFICAFLI